MILMELKKTFGKNVRYYRFKKKYTQAKLAELLDVSTNYVSRMERGQHSTSFDVIEELSKILDIEPYKFFLKSKDTDLPLRVDMKKKSN